MTNLEHLDMTDPAVQHSLRFRKVSTRYPRMVAQAYDRDIAQAALDDDATVAARVAGYERSHGLEPRDWAANGDSERGDLEGTAAARCRCLVGSAAPLRGCRPGGRSRAGVRPCLENSSAICMVEWSKACGVRA